MPKTTPIDFLAYKKRIGINHQQLEICGVGFTPFPSISTKIWCDGICRTNMHQRWYDFFWLCRTMGPNVITSWPEKQQLIALLWVFFQCRTLCKSTCSLKIVPLIKRNTYRSRLPWFRMSKYGRCRGWTRDGRIGLMVLVGVTWNITGQEFDKAWFWKVLWLDDMAVRCAEKNRHVFFDLYPWTSRIQTGKKHCSHYLDLCNSWCLWVIMNQIFCLHPGFGMEGDARVFSNRTGFSKEMSCEKNIHKVKH